ncbi:hypothetical protein ABH961_003285 [Bacillus sp. RC251]|uniref:DUF7018 domain-containing (lipo)protein n=1 Tax=Bacillus sp. RC251 TaxID=3156290 RepID=UPI0038385986
MKAKKLVMLAIPVMLLVGCGTDKVDSKAKDKVESKAETKEKLSKDIYPVRMTSLSSELMGKITNIVEVAMNKEKDEKTLKKEVLKQESELQTIIAKFDKIEPPKEYAKSHKDLLKAVDCYSKAYSKQAKYFKANEKDIDPDKKQEITELIERGNKYWISGFQPVQDETSRVGAVNANKAVKDKQSALGDTDSDTIKRTDDAPKSNDVSNLEEVTKYKQDIIDSSNAIADTMHLIEGIAGSDIKAYVQKKSEIQLSVGGAKANAKKLKELKAPSGFEGEQNEIKQSMQYYEDAFQLLFDAIEQEDQAKLHESMGKTHIGAKIFDEATKGIADKSKQ